MDIASLRLTPFNINLVVPFEGPDDIEWYWGIAISILRNKDFRREALKHRDDPPALEKFSKKINNYFIRLVMNFAMFEGNYKIVAMWTPAMGSGMIEPLHMICPCSWPFQAIRCTASIIKAQSFNLFEMSTTCLKAGTVEHKGLHHPCSGLDLFITDERSRNTVMEIKRSLEPEDGTADPPSKPKDPIDHFQFTTDQNLNV